MKPSVVLVSFIVGGALGGCADRGLEPSNTGPVDFAHAQDFAAPSDLSFNDLGSGCMQIGTWMSDQLVFAINETPSSSPGYAWDDYVEGTRSGNYPDGGSDILYYEFYQQVMSNQPIPVPHSIDPSDPNEEVGLVLDTPADGSSGTYFIATSGSMTVTAVDDTQPTGNVAVHGTNITLEEIDDSGEIVPNGPCVQIGSLDLSAMYDNSPSE